MPKLVVGKTYSFAAAHHLPEHKGLCRNVHGHNYKVEVEISGEIIRDKVSSQGMVLDFFDLDVIVKPRIDEFDHSDLNDYFGDEDTPTAECLSEYLARGIHDSLALFHPNVTLERVRVWETDKCYAEWRRG